MTDHTDLLAQAEAFHMPIVTDLADALRAETARADALIAELDDTRTINETDEPRGLRPAVEYWRARWADAASSLTDLLAERDALAAAATEVVNLLSGHTINDFRIDALRALVDPPCATCGGHGELLVFPFDGTRGPCPDCIPASTGGQEAT